MSGENDYAEAFIKALRALAGGAADGAAEIAEGLLLRRPDDPSVHQLMAAVELRRSKPADAARWAASSLSARPNHYSTLILAAQASRALDDWSGAVERYRRAAEIEPERPEAAFGAALTAIHESLDSAAGVVDDLARRFPDYGPGWEELGGHFERNGSWRLAAQAFTYAMNERPSAKLSVRLGSALQALGRRDQAATYYQKALEIDPKSAEAWFKLGLALHDGRLPAQAAEAYRRALSLRPGLAEAETNLGMALQEQRQLDSAKQAYGRAINLRPSTFGRVAQALATAPKGELWLDLGALRAHLLELGRLSR